MGKGIVLRESTAVLYTFTCLIAPLLGYKYYAIDNGLSRLWVKYMPVPENVYFGYAIPAIIFFCLALTWPIGIRESLDEGTLLHKTISRIREKVDYKNGGIIVGFGLAVSFVISYLPESLQFFVTLFFFGSFAGLLYLFYYPKLKYKKLIIFSFVVFIFISALRSGMFTIVAYMGVTIFSFFLLGLRVSLLKKLLLVTVSIFFLIVLQNVKLSYRKLTWLGSYDGSKIELFTNLFIEKLGKGDALIEKDAFFPVYARTNQGFNVALVMRRMPAVVPYDGGDKLFTVFLSSFVPRFLWPDKPMAGGKFNMAYYAGFKLQGWSTDIGPLGEAYGSFGVNGGIVYMFFLGFFIRWAYKRVFILSKKYPLLICWLPVLFYQVTYSAETDTLQILNSLTKSAFFLWLLFKILPHWFGIIKKKSVKFVAKRSVPQNDLLAE